MAKFESPLNNIKIASPCPANWDAMYGDERKRFCGECKLNVYNLSGMTRDEAENLLMTSEGRLCVRIFQRADGSVITKDCPVGWAKVKQRAQMVATAVFSLVITLFGGLLFTSFFAKKSEVGKMRWIPFSTPTPELMPLAGAIALPERTPAPTPSPKATPKATPDGRKTMGIRISPKKTSDVNENAPIVN